MHQTTIDEPVIRKLLDVLEHGLTRGLGTQEPGKFCVEAAVCYALGLPHGDDPGCVSSAVRALKIRLNDSRWSSNQARAKGLRRLAVIQLGTKDIIDDKEFAQQAATAAIRICVPGALRAAAKVAKGRHVEALLEVALLCANEPTQANALKAKETADAAAAADAAYAAAATYAAAAADAAYAAAATYAAAYAADAAYAAYAAYAADAADAARDAMLSEFAEGVVQILVEMKAPGAKWLTLTGER